MHLNAYCRHASNRTCVLLVLVLLAARITVMAQTSTGRIEGSVQHQTGSVIANVAALPNGEYALTAEAPGFGKYGLNDTTLEGGASFNTVITLDVGQTTGSVQVEATTVNVQTRESQFSRPVTMRDIDTLPQLGWTPITLSLFVPGVSYGGTNPGDNTLSRVNGQRQGSNNAGPVSDSE